MIRKSIFSENGVEFVNKDGKQVIFWKGSGVMKNTLFMTLRDDGRVNKTISLTTEELIEFASFVVDLAIKEGTERELCILDKAERTSIATK